MTIDTLADTPSLGVPWCPGCDPDRDPLVGIPDVRWCDTHANRAGTEDVLLVLGDPLSGMTEAGGDVNRIWCNALHRGQWSV